MKVKKWGRMCDMEYIEICADFEIPDVHYGMVAIAALPFMEVEPDGRIGFTCGKLKEIRGLRQSCIRKGYTPCFKT